MKKYIPILALTLIFSSCSELNLGTLGEIIEPVETSPLLSEAEVGSGLKEALVQGVNRSVSSASAQDGFFKNPLLFIAFPEEANVVKEKALSLGLDAQVNQFEMTMNRAAEEASKAAAPIFISAVQNMTIEDAFGILNGSDSAASDFLKRKTSAELTASFTPKVTDAINKVELTKHWEPLVSKYNLSTLLTGKEPINEDLTAYITEKAIDGLFVHITAEEKLIRKDPKARATDLLERVFGSIQP